MHALSRWIIFGEGFRVSPLQLAMERALDVVASLGLLTIAAPFILLTVLAIKLEDGFSAPILYRQRRVGRHSLPFDVLKFRSMSIDAEKDGAVWAMKDDPRVTRVGVIIRKTRIDELPQLFNVLLGDMSLVGPRPPLPSEVAQYMLEDRGRLGAAPGITCIWQVSGRSEIPFPQQVEMDLDYIHRQSLAEDVRLLFKTVPALVRGRGAY